MELKISRTELGRAMKVAARLVDKSSKIPMAACVLLRAETGGATVNAVGPDIAMTAAIACAVTGKGSVAINAAELARIAGDAPGEDISIRVGDDGWTEVKSAKARYKLAHLNGRDYPVIPEASGTWTSADAPTLVEALRRGSLCPCLEGDRGALMGVLIDTETRPGELTVVSTDGKRLAMHRVSMTLPKVRRAVPTRWSEMARMIAGSAEKVELCIEAKSSGRIHLRLGGTVISSPWFVEEFPSARSLAPFFETPRPVSITANRERIVAAVKRLAAIADECHGIVIATRDAAIALSVRDANGREIDDELDAEAKGEITIGINARFLAECLSVMTGDAVELRMKDPLDPVEARDGGNTGFTGILMPMRV